MVSVGIGMKIATVGAGIGILVNGASNYATGNDIFDNVGWAAGFGALCAPLAVAVPIAGVGLALWGTLASISQVYHVLGDVNSSFGQRATSIALVGLACFGNYAAVKNVRVNGFWFNSKVFIPKTSGGTNNQSTINAVENTGGRISLSPIFENAQQQPPPLKNIPRLLQDINVSPKAPSAKTTGTIGKNANQYQALQNWINILKKHPEVKDIRVNQQQVNVNGVRVGINRPDLQFTQGGKRYYAEWDTSSSNRGIPHGERIMANDPDGLVYIFTLD
jgi:hypothetical protein